MEKEILCKCTCGEEWKVDFNSWIDEQRKRAKKWIRPNGSISKSIQKAMIRNEETVKNIDKIIAKSGHMSTICPMCQNKALALIQLGYSTHEIGEFLREGTIRKV